MRAWAGEDGPQILSNLCTLPPAHQSLEIAAEVDLTALPARPLKVPFDGSRESLVIIAGHELHPAQATCLQTSKEFLVGRLTLSGRHIDCNQLTEAIVAHGTDQQDALTHDLPALPDFLVAGIHCQVGIGVAVKGRSRHAWSRASNWTVKVETWLFEKRVPHNCSVIVATFRVDTPCRYISMSVSTRACSLRWYLPKSSVEKDPSRSCGTSSPTCPPASATSAACSRCDSHAARRPFVAAGAEMGVHLRLEQRLQRLLDEFPQKLRFIDQRCLCHTRQPRRIALGHLILLRIRRFDSPTILEDGGPIRYPAIYLHGARISFS